MFRHFITNAFKIVEILLLQLLVILFEEIEPLVMKYIGSLNFKNHEDDFIDQNIRINLNKENINYEEESSVKATVSRYYNKKFTNTFSERLKNKILLSVIDKLMFNEIREKINLYTHLMHTNTSTKNIQENYQYFYGIWI